MDSQPPRSFRTLISIATRTPKSIKDLKALRALPIAAAIDMQVLKDLKRVRLDVYSYAEPGGPEEGVASVRMSIAMQSLMALKRGLSLRSYL